MPKFRYTALNADGRQVSGQLEAEGEAIQLDSITRHFETLIDGYEKRVKDLTDEVEALRKEVQSLRQALDKRPRL